MMIASEPLPPDFKLFNKTTFSFGLAQMIRDSGIEVWALQGLSTMSHRNILWITLESFRWDHTDFADYVRDMTSNLEDLVSAGTFCSNNCCSHGIYTRSSTASILTGQPQSKHGVEMYRTQIPKSIFTILEQLFREGYWNVCIPSNGHISQATSLNRGFDKFRFITGPIIGSEVNYALLEKYLLNLFENSGELTTETSQYNISYLNNESMKDHVDQATIWTIRCFYTCTTGVAITRITGHDLIYQSQGGTNHDSVPQGISCC